MSRISTNGTNYALALQPLAKRVVDLQNQVPLNAQDLPIAYINSGTLATLNVTDDPALAMERISYSEGFPTINGLPFWEKIEGESADHYALFKVYRNLPASQRTIVKVAELTDLTPRELHTIAQLNHWTLRIIAFEQYQTMVLDQVRAENVRRMANKHSKAAEKAFEVTNDFLKTHVQELTPKTALEWLKFAVELERMSYGLDPKGAQPNTNSGSQGGTSVVINQQIAQGNSAAPSSRSSDQQRVLEIAEILRSSGAFQQPEMPTEEATHEEVTHGEVPHGEVAHGEVIDVDATPVDERPATRLKAVDNPKK